MCNECLTCDVSGDKKTANSDHLSFRAQGRFCLLNGLVLGCSPYTSIHTTHI